MRARRPILLLVAAACGSRSAVIAPEPDGPRVTGRVWALVDLGGRSSVRSAAGARPTLLLSEQNWEAHAFAGCDSLVARYRIALDSLRFGPFAGAGAPCGPGPYLEEQLAAAFAATTNYRVMNGALELGGAAGVLARFEPADRCDDPRSGDHRYLCAARGLALVEARLGSAIARANGRVWLGAALDSAQAAWSRLRDAECGREPDRPAAGGALSLAEIQCRLVLTQRRAARIETAFVDTLLPQ